MNDGDLKREVKTEMLSRTLQECVVLLSATEVALNQRPNAGR
ncbi:hypothetical protein EV132_11246 [Rhizobium sullae]|uniref:Uncharacterized protein n=1 Tax=Rhizobium sullae TaxID=50338 RepID=A0A4R3PXH0_RHISU|nr:hypothetical protein EV132_11246 [Rhizobium sullae]